MGVYVPASLEQELTPTSLCQSPAYSPVSPQDFPLQDIRSLLMMSTYCAKRTVGTQCPQRPIADTAQALE